jgi:uncharacterized protein (DUF169 family)
MGKEDMLCPLGALTLGFLPIKPKYLDGSFNVPFWVKDQDIRAKMARNLPHLEQGKYTHLIAAPFHRADFEPQVIIIYGNPAQIARLIQASIYSTGEPMVSRSAGQFIVTGGGDRAVAQTQDDEISFAVPISKAEALMEGLERTHKAGMRYPTPSSLIFKAQFPPSFSELMDYLRKGG